MATSTHPDRQLAGTRIARTAYFGAGTLFVVIGVAGMFLPLVPTTIFLILAGACYARSSPAAHRWLTTNRLFGGYLRNYQEHRGATPRAKILSIAVLWLGIGATMVFAPIALWVDAILVAIAVGVTWHLLTLKTIRATV